MKIQHLRNATTLLAIAEHRLLVDPMLAEAASFPGFKLFGGGRQDNPLVAMPSDTETILSKVTDVLITHEHPDHLDPAAIQWIQDHKLPVWASTVDAPNLERKGLQVRLMEDGALGMAVEVIPTVHGRGLIGWLMGPVSGYFLAHPEEPSVYITSDAVLTETIQETVQRLQPDLIVAPAGAANFGVGRDLLFSVDELVELVRMAPGEVILNHLESLDHCPTTRQGLRERMASEGLAERVHIPDDGEEVHFTRRGDNPHASPRASTDRKPSFQKWLTQRFAGT